MTETKRLRDHNAEIAIILGSGLNSIVVGRGKDHIVPYAEFSEIPQPSALPTTLFRNERIRRSLRLQNLRL
jgi:purine nucleoside phosphorylase